ncbi:uncharacterized protein EV154DRAFT_487274 [Mucor mucedo]|uniref:uncharacterized protein n=1 Tax=Mucor mucedo TaxID=29922 RepID=UPI00221FA4C5|nr:uncharacterized protein EV154DRAFT_487274 [Mucor mucedo]KAI7873348.1 hypothetical protein EV154DRAFT_487274 [Mucor mucedo]
MKSDLLELLANVNTDPLARKKSRESSKWNSMYRKNVNNYFNNNGKRSNGIFNTPGGKSTNFTNRLLKTTIPNQGNEDSDLQDREDVEDEEQLQTLFLQKKTMLNYTPD